MIKTDFFDSKVRENCPFCDSSLVYDVDRTVTYRYPEKCYIVRNVPKMNCNKCGIDFQALPFQFEKTAAFMDQLEKLHFNKVDISFEDIMSIMSEPYGYSSESE